jgi:hypothetical protein
MHRIPSEINLGWVYLPPLFLSVAIGFLLAYQIAAVLNMTGLRRYFVHPPIAFVALWVLTTSMIGIFFLPP